MVNWKLKRHELAGEGERVTQRKDRERGVERDREGQRGVEMERDGERGPIRI